MLQPTDDQLLAFLAQYLPDNEDELISPAALRYVLTGFVQGKLNREELVTFAALASPHFTGVPQVPTAPAGTNSDQAASTAFVLAAIATVAGGKNLSELALPQDVQGGFWYLTTDGIWEARRAFAAAAAPASGANWRLVASFTGQLTSVSAANISDASAAGRAMLTAPTAAVQRGLVNNPRIAANQYGSHPKFDTEDGPNGAWAWVIKAVLALASVQVVQPPAAPTAGKVNDVSKEFSFTANPAYPSFAQYKVSGLPGTTEPVYLSAANSYQIDSTIYLKVGSAVAKGGLAVYVAGSGNIPDGVPLLSKDAFTGVVVVSQPAAPDFSGFDDVANTVSVSHATLPTSELRYDFNGATGLSVPNNNVISVGNLAGQVVAYARANGSRPEGLRRNSQPFTITQADNAPTVSLSSPQAGQTLNVGDPFVLNASPADADGPQDIKKVQHLDNGAVFAETTAFPHTVQGSITGGAHSFTARVYDMLGASGLSNPISITGTATPTVAAKPACFVLDGNSLATRDYSNGDWYAVLLSLLTALIASKTPAQLAAAGLTNAAPILVYQTPDGTIIPVSGQTAYAMDNAAADVDGVFNGAFACFLLTVGEPYNGTRTDAPVYTPQQAADYYNQYCTDRKAAHAWQGIISLAGFDDKAGTSLGYNQPAGGYTAVRDLILSALDAQKTQGINKWDVLAKVDPAFNQLDPNLSPDKIHALLKAYVDFLLPRLVAGVNEAIFGVAQPAPVFAGVTAPTISSFSPASAAVGSTVTVTGARFTGVTSVSVNGTAATVFSVVSDTQLTFTIPTGATSGTFVVTNSAGSAISATLTIGASSGGGTGTGSGSTAGPYSGLLSFTDHTAALQNANSLLTSSGGDWNAAVGLETQYRRAANTRAILWLIRLPGDEFCMIGLNTANYKPTINVLPIGLFLVDDPTYGPNINIVFNGGNPINIDIGKLDYSAYGLFPNDDTKRIDILGTNDDPTSANPTLVRVNNSDPTKDFPAEAYTDAALYPVVFVNGDNNGRGRNITLVGGTPFSLSAS